MRYICDWATKIHSRNLKKPNEDYIYADAEKGIFILLDGVTRVHSEYEERPMESAAADISEIFGNEAVRYISESEDECAETVLREAVKSANRAVLEYRSRKTGDEWKYYPATLGIIALICNGRMHWFCAGDCLGAIIRGSSKLFFGNETVTAAVDLLKPEKRERYEKYCNHPENPLGYTVFNGDDGVEESGEYSFIDLCGGDTVILSSDGSARALLFEKCRALKGKSASEIADLSDKFDIPPFGEYGDDKAVIKIEVK